MNADDYAKITGPIYREDFERHTRDPQLWRRWAMGPGFAVRRTRGAEVSVSRAGPGEWDVYRLGARIDLYPAPFCTVEAGSLILACKEADRVAPAGAVWSHLRYGYMIREDGLLLEPCDLGRGTVWSAFWTSPDERPTHAVAEFEDASRTVEGICALVDEQIPLYSQGEP